MSCYLAFDVCSLTESSLCYEMWPSTVQQTSACTEQQLKHAMQLSIVHQVSKLNNTSNVSIMLFSSLLFNRQAPTGAWFAKLALESQSIKKSPYYHAIINLLEQQIVITVMYRGATLNNQPVLPYSIMFHLQLQSSWICWIFYNL